MGRPTYKLDGCSQDFSALIEKGEEMQSKRRLGKAALMLIVALPVFPQDGAKERKPEIPSVAHVAVMYNDLEVGRAFMQQLGFEVGFDVKLEGQLNQYE